MEKLEILNNLEELFKKEQLSIYYFALKYKIDQQEIIDRLHQLGYLFAGKRAKYHLIIGLKEASEEYLNDDSIQAREICAKYNIGHETFSKYMRDYLNKPIRARVKSKFNDKYFDEIDCEEKAYLLGFLYADGYVCFQGFSETKKAYTIELSLQKRDLEILEFMKKELQTSRPIIFDPNHGSEGRYRLLVNSMHMWNTLNNYGCTPRKSFTEVFPDESIFKSKDLIRHFIRGYFNGDGCVTYTSNNKPRIHLMGTYEFLKTLKTYLPESCKNLTICHNHSNPEEEMRFISTSHSKAKEILLYLYKNTKIYLTRKFNRYIALCCSDITNAEDKNGED